MDTARSKRKMTTATAWKRDKKMKKCTSQASGTAAGSKIHNWMEWSAAYA